MKFKSMFVYLLIAVALIGCNKDKKAEKEQKENNTTKENTAAKGITATPNDSLEPIEIAFGEYDKMFDFCKKCQNNELPEGQIVIIDGEMSVQFRSASIGQRKAEGEEYVGTSLIVKGWEEENFPGDESRVKVKAFTVLEKEYGYLYLVAEPADVEIIKDTNAEETAE